MLSYIEGRTQTKSDENRLQNRIFGSNRAEVTEETA
jgi:hypothetical protein